MTRILATALGAICLTMTSLSAHAVPTTFDFTTAPAGALSNPLTCNAATAGGGLCGISGPGSATLQGWRFNDPDDPLSAASLRQFQGGSIGNKGIGIDLGGGDSQEIDNVGPDEFMSITFGAAFDWTLVSITLNRFAVEETVDTDILNRADSVVFYGSNDPLGTTTNWIELAPTSIDVLTGLDIPGSVKFSFDPGQIFDHIYVRTGVQTGQDDFVLAQVVGNTNVPEPATLALLGLGLAGLGMTRRRRKA